MPSTAVTLAVDISAALHTSYIDATSGSDTSTRDGSVGSPWKSLHYACGRATTSGYVIHVNAGTYAETSARNLPVGVCIEGEGTTSLIRSSVTGSGSGAGVWTIRLNSSMGTNGNQHISNIKMDEIGLAAWGAIGATRRNRSHTFMGICIGAMVSNRGMGDLWQYNQGMPRSRQCLQRLMCVFI